ncbi:uncharacterized protein LOC123542069 [Mercenaria mercenaria]|uniref:uncharacterized protein LOC123542069 n=1 Tax=Mercenaria mercenaria TaxID=6596 RepID=UPI00234F9DE4|nr:uncharacterized protein LOC123542069 [Mercenaria mercenaria]
MDIFYYLYIIYFSALHFSNAATDGHTCSKFPYEEQLLEKMIRVEAKVEKWDTELSKFEESVLSVLEHRKEEMQRQLKRFSQEYNKLKQDISTSERPDTPIIAFNAYTTEGGDYIKDKVIVFPHVLLNEGSGYNPDTGYFTVPATGAGLYHFTTHVCQFGGQFMAFSIIQGDQIIALSTVYEDRDNSCNSASAPAKLEIGERVNVQSTYNASRLFSNTHRWPSFMGYFIHLFIIIPDLYNALFMTNFTFKGALHSSMQPHRAHNSSSTSTDTE